MRKEITTGARRGGRGSWLAVILGVCMIITILPAAAVANDDIMELKLMPEPFQAIQSMTPRFKYARNPKNTQHNCRKSPNWLEHTDLFHDIITDTGNILKRGVSIKWKRNV